MKASAGTMTAAMKHAGTLLLLSAGLLALACSPVRQARDVSPSGFLPDYSILRKGGQNEAILTYYNTRADWPRYRRVILEPVLRWSPGTPAGKETPTAEEREQFLRNFYHMLRDELSDTFDLVEAPGPGTLQVQAAVTQILRTWETGPHVSSEDYLESAVGTAQEYATGKPLYSVDVSVEFQVTDARTGTLLHASVDRRFGGNVFQGNIGRWEDVNGVLRVWSRQLGWKLCKLTEKQSCGEPVR